MSDRKKKDALTESVLSLSKNISEMVSKQNRSNEEAPMKYESIWRSLDDMFQKMEEKDVFELNMHFVAMAYEKIKN